MATLTKTLTENWYPDNPKATWTVTISGTDQIVDKDFILSLPSVLAKFVRSARNKGSVWLAFQFYIDGQQFNISGAWARPNYNESLDTIPMASGTMYQIPHFDEWGNIDTKVLKLSDLFSASNKTKRQLPVTMQSTSGNIHLNSENSAGTDFNEYSNEGVFDWGTISTITLDAPPTFDVTQVSVDTAAIYTDHTTASVTVSNATAKYGGDIVSSKLTIGTQTVIGTGNGVLSLLLTEAGTFTPAVTVTDSRGQETTKLLDPITVNQYTAPRVVFSAERSDLNGTPNDEGTAAVLSATFSYIKALGNLLRPDISLNGTAQPAAYCTWYTTRSSAGVVSGAVDWSNFAPDSPVTLYGIISGLNTWDSYEIGITAKDTYTSGQEITRTIGQAFFTLDFLAGGHGVAFGQLARLPGLFFGMPTFWKRPGDTVASIALVDFFYPVGSYYETSDTSFDPNTQWGGRWDLELEGQVHVSAGSNYTVDGAMTGTSDGGEKTHKLITAEMPAHSHEPSVTSENFVTSGDADANNTRVAYSSSGNRWVDGLASQSHFHHRAATNSVGSGNAHNNMQPYIIVNRWHRTA